MKPLRKLQEFLMCVLFAALPLEELTTVHIGVFPLSCATIVLLLLLYTIVLSLFVGDIKVPRAALFPFLLLIGLFALDVLSIPGSDRQGIMESSRSMIAVMVFAITVVLLPRNRHLARKGIQALALVLAVGGILALVQSLGYPIWSEIHKPLSFGEFVFPLNRTTGYPMSYGGYGILNVSVLPLAVLSLVRGKGLYSSRWIALLVSVLVLLAVVISQSRSTWLAVGTAFGIMLFSATYRTWRKKAVFAWLVAIATLSIFGVGFAWNLGVDLYEANSISIQQRYDQYAAALKMLRSNPVAGIGYGQFSKLYEPIDVPWETAAGARMLHNYFLNKAVATGIIGPLLTSFLLAWIVSVYWRSIQQKGEEISGWFMVGLLSSLVGVLIEMCFYPGGSGIKIFWILVGIAAVCSRESITLKGG